MSPCPVSAPRPVVLIVDDDPAVLSAMAFLFETEGFETQCFASGEALLAAGDPPANACLIVDQILPGLSGLDALARLRARGVIIPAFLITTNPSRLLIERASVGGAEIVEKPLLGDALLSRVRAAFDRR